MLIDYFSAAGLVSSLAGIGGTRARVVGIFFACFSVIVATTLLGRWADIDEIKHS